MTIADALDLEREPVAAEPLDAALANSEVIDRLRLAILGGQHWFTALLDAAGRWRLPEERYRGRVYRFLTGGEAFDWLLLADRLLDGVADLVPPAEAQALLFNGRWPVDLDDAEFAERLGPAKYSAHLNYLYGVLVEEALQLSVEEEMHKESRNRPWGQDRREDESLYQRVYQHAFDELVALYAAETKRILGTEVALPEWKDFTYWLFKFRLRQQDKARVASDTRKGLAQLTRMELAVSARRRGAVLASDDFAARFGVA